MPRSGAAGDHLLAPGRRSSARSGSATSWSTPARPGPSRSAGPTPTPSPRPWASAPWSQQWADRHACRSPSCGPRSSSRRSPSHGRVGSAASAWPSRSSSPTPAACCASSPACPRASIDVIPVDLVVAAILAVAAHGAGRRRGRAVYHVASGVRNPLPTASWSTCPGLVRPHTRSTTSGASPSPCPNGRSPAAAGSSASSAGPTRLMSVAEKLPHCAARPGQAGRAGRPNSRSATPWPKRALGYVELYGAYTETEARYRVDRLLELWDDLRRRGPARRSASTPASSTGTTTSTTSTCPRCVEHARVRTTPGTSVGRTSDPSGPRKAILSPDRHLAVFDLEHTLIVLQRRRHLRLAGQPPPAAGPAGPLRGRPRAPGARRCWRSTGATGATSCAPSTAATRTRRWPSCEARRLGAVPRASC